MIKVTKSRFAVPSPSSQDIMISPVKEQICHTMTRTLIAASAAQGWLLHRPLWLKRSPI
jgi:hypothetical protein